MSWDLLAHEWAEKLLKQHIAQGDTRHAYLFTGAPGTGRRTLALQFTKALNCLEPPAPGEFCGKCRICKQIERMQHPDLFIAQADVVGGTLKIDTVRSVQHDLNMLPFDAKWRTALFLRFEEANASAQNALLKTLEEPPDSSKLLITASNENALLPTISSRCEVIRLRPMALDALQNALVERKGLTLEDALRVAHLSAGRVGYAMRLADDPDEIERVMGIARDGVELLGESAQKRFAYALGFKDVKKRPLLRESLLIWQSLFRDLLLLSAGSAEEQPLSYTDLSSELSAIAAEGSRDEFRVQLSNINKMLMYLDYNANLQLLTETLLLDWPCYAVR